MEVSVLVVVGGCGGYLLPKIACGWLHEVTLPIIFCVCVCLFLFVCVCGFNMCV